MVTAIVPDALGWQATSIFFLITMDCVGMEYCTCYMYTDPTIGQQRHGCCIEGPHFIFFIYFVSILD